MSAFIVEFFFLSLRVTSVVFVVWHVQCALLIGAGSPFSGPLYAIRAACARLQDPTCEGRQLLAQAQEINTQSAAVRKIALERAEQAQQPSVKRFYMSAAKETTGLTAAVVQSVTVCIFLYWHCLIWIVPMLYDSLQLRHHETL